MATIPDTLPRFALRMAASAVCNMACVYCPQPNMENLTPVRHRGRMLSHESLSRIMCNVLNAVPFDKLCFTGGEPLMNPRLHELARTAVGLVPRLELNTNGVLLTSDRWQELQPFFDQIKISIETLDADDFQRLTNFNGTNGLHRVLAAVELVRRDDVELVLNGVVMRRTLNGVYRLIDYVAERGLWLHLLDFNFTPECAAEWEREFIPNEELITKLSERYGEAFEVQRFGCGYYEFYPSPDAVIRLRTSYSGTMRSQRCATCKHYCQTGLFGLRLSTHGWVTYCFSDLEIDGVLLDPGMSVNQTRDLVAPLVSDIADAKLVTDSLPMMINRHELCPLVPLDLPQIARGVHR